MTIEQINREAELYEECADLAELLGKKKGVDVLKPFAEKWDEKVSSKREPNTEWLELFKKELEEAIEE